MNVEQLIAELRKYPPHLPVRVVPSEVYIADEAGESMIPLCVEDATEAEQISGQGGFVLIQGK